MYKLQSIVAILSKIESITEFFLHEFFQVALSKISENFLRNIFEIL